MKKLFGYARLDIEDIESTLINIGELATKNRMYRKGKELDKFLLEGDTIISTNTINIKDVFNNNIAILTFDPDYFPKRIYDRVEKLFEKLMLNKQLNKKDLLKLYRYSKYISTPLMQVNSVSFDFTRKPDKLIIF